MELIHETKDGKLIGFRVPGVTKLFACDCTSSISITAAKEKATNVLRHQERFPSVLIAQASLGPVHTKSVSRQRKISADR